MNELGPQYRLEELQRRWQGQKSPSVALQLAEEYRTRRRLKEAVAVLEEGLAAHPDHPAAEVALARDLLDLGHARPAAGVLEKVVARDPIHLVANKLLVTAYTRSERPKDARDRLDLYALLNEGDPDIESLESRLAAHAEEPFALAETAITAVSLAEVAPPAVTVESRGGVRAAHVASSSDPFAELWSGVEEVAPTSDVFGDLFSLPAIGPSDGEAEIEPEVEVGDIFGTVSTEPAGETTTATLGQLHLEQGHVVEAEEIFAQVLEREPDNESARGGLEAATARRSGGILTAAELIGDDGAALEPTARKMLLLRSYLARLKGKAN